MHTHTHDWFYKHREKWMPLTTALWPPYLPGSGRGANLRTWFESWLWKFKRPLYGIQFVIKLWVNTLSNQPPKPLSPGHHGSVLGCEAVPISDTRRQCCLVVLWDPISRDFSSPPLYQVPLAKGFWTLIVKRWRDGHSIVYFTEILIY